MMKEIRKSKAALLILLILGACIGGCRNNAPEATLSTPPATEPPAETVETVMPVPQPATQPQEDQFPGSITKAEYKSDQAACVVFLQAWEPREVYVPVDYILSYETQYPECNGTWFKDQLTGEDLCIYNAYFYAMENCLTGFVLYVEDNDRDFDHVRNAVCLDSPFLEQNISRYGEAISGWPTNYIGERIWFNLEIFTEDRWRMKMDALEVCRQIVAGIPSQYLTQLEKMQYLYNYVCEHVEYVEYESMADESYLYDAVCKGESVCDGYSNMLNLLFNLIGVECCEAMGGSLENFDLATPEERATYFGHTWVVANVDGVFYNFDPTYEDGTAIFWEEDDLLFFGFSDALMPVRYSKLDDMRPQCTDTSWDFSYADLVVENVTDNSQIQKVAEFTDRQAKNGEYVTLLAVKTAVTEEVQNNFLGEYVEKTNEISSVKTSTISMENYTLIVITTEPRCVAE